MTTAYEEETEERSKWKHTQTHEYVREVVLRRNAHTGGGGGGSLLKSVGAENNVMIRKFVS